MSEIEKQVCQRVLELIDNDLSSLALSQENLEKFEKECLEYEESILSMAEWMTSNDIPRRSSSNRRLSEMQGI